MNTSLSFPSKLAHPIIQAVVSLAKQQGGQAYLVGGAVRDLLLTGELPLDLDFTLLNCSAAPLAKALADSQAGHLVPLDWEFGIHRVVFTEGELAGLNVDLADALQNNLDTDLARRDLTINAMAMDLATGALVDPFNGQADLAARTVKMVSALNLLDDPLRMLRVFRIAATVQAECIDEATLAVVAEHGAKVWESAAERVQYEFFRLLSVENCFAQVKAMADCGLLEVLIPDLTPMKAIGSSGFHHLGLFDHTLELVKQAERLIAECPEHTQAWVRQAFTPAVTRFGLIKLACLLHDIGKPATMGTREDSVHGQRLTFYGHEEVGEEMAEPLLKQWKVSNEVRTYLKKLIRWHLYPCQFGPESPRKSVLKYYRRMGEDTLDVTLLALADRHSACGDWLSQEAFDTAHQAHLWLMANYEREEPVLNLPRLLNGKDLMDLLSVGPGPHLKKMLGALQEAQQLGEVNDAEQAKHWVMAQFGAGKIPTA
ncbi:CCA tRNA nucleotidyltransferase [Vampirovibrio sp.]|uniref:CCA tRNA nucleotidyltransferase n=1 Tax=Vampirovibrio sp. TaxID=2717857 RepID=UPI0035934E08